MKKAIFVVFMVLLLQHFVFAKAAPHFYRQNATPLTLAADTSLFNINNNMLHIDTGTQTSMPRHYGRIPAWAAFGANLLFGFGIGSFIQGDLFGGTVAIAVDVAALGLSFMTGPWVIPGYYMSWMVGLGVSAMLLGSRIFQIIRPWYYDLSGKLALAIALNEYRGLSFSPVFTHRF